jgi:acetyl-CoA acetyltransferase
MDRSLQGRAVIVGIGDLDYGELYRAKNEVRSAEDLAARALAVALEDCGLTKDDIDGLELMRVESYQRFAAMTGMKPGQLRHVNRFEEDGRFCGVALQTAIMAVATGLADVVACVYGNNGRSAGATYGGGQGDAIASYETIFGMTSPGAAVAHSYSRYRKKYGVPDGALAPLAINNRNNAINNPRAVMRQPLTLEQYLAARYIAEPLRLFDYCLINDGAVAVIVTTPERARALRKPPVSVHATSGSTDLSMVYQSQDEFYASAKAAADELWSTAGLGPADMQVAQIYDNFTPTILYSLEAFGYCDRGSAWEWVQDGVIALGGKLPINTSGAHTSESYMQGWNHVVELVRQLRGESSNQIPGCEVGQYICASPITTSLILTRP